MSYIDIMSNAFGTLTSHRKSLRCLQRALSYTHDGIDHTSNPSMVSFLVDLVNSLLNADEFDLPGNE